MKTSEALKEYHHNSAHQLYITVNEQKQKLIQLRQDFLLGKLKNTSEFKKIRKNIARLMTVIDEKISQEIEDK